MHLFVCTLHWQYANTVQTDETITKQTLSNKATEQIRFLVCYFPQYAINIDNIQSYVKHCLLIPRCNVRIRLENVMEKFGFNSLLFI